MAYNQGLAVGLVVGLPCVIVLIGLLVFYRWNRRKIREEDLQANALDMEMGDNNLFTEFGEALHRPIESAGHTKESNLELSTGKLALKLAQTPQNTEHMTKSVSDFMELPSDSPKTLLLPDRKTTDSHQTRKLPGKYNSGSSYDFYDTVIPIMPPEHQRPSLSASGNSEQHSRHSSRGSLLHPETLSRLLENLAKLLQNPQFFEKVPSKSGTLLMQQHPRRSRPDSSRNSSYTDLTAPFENGGINDHFVNERLVFPDLDQLPQTHPYRERLNRSGPAAKPGLDLENNFDNDISPDTTTAAAPDVVFK